MFGYWIGIRFVLNGDIGGVVVVELGCDVVMIFGWIWVEFGVRFWDGDELDWVFLGKV